MFIDDNKNLNINKIYYKCKYLHFQLKKQSAKIIYLKSKKEIDVLKSNFFNEKNKIILC